MPASRACPRTAHARGPRLLWLLLWQLLWLLLLLLVLVLPLLLLWRLLVWGCIVGASVV